MKQRVVLLISIITFIMYCFFKTEKKQSGNKTPPLISLTDKVISIANSYNGVPYKPGGTTSKGMDCSGLVQTSFKQINVLLPRSSSSMSNKGKKISTDKIKLGDLLFFNINRLKGKINHVGLVTNIDNHNIYFIHSTTSKGVITNSLNDPYWKTAFVKAKRVLN
ncbi:MULTISPECIES: C40 family peptidase [Tenacibaculum]|uniref:C40 family peptidase n=1 Tax=Tenacibaculum TaxID=104267 RepID=UPI000DE91A78|nr:C40 family peptidase [Tenacibaculum sp. E3R01]RBW59855.1 NlpC/P60 family protein [Tenacibaculum sp. E3R01]